jgi:hypothetical protein
MGKLELENRFSAEYPIPARDTMLPPVVYNFSISRISVVFPLRFPTTTRIRRHVFPDRSAQHIRREPYRKNRFSVLIMETPFYL